MSREAPHSQLCPPNAPILGYTLLRHVGFVLDELSAQGLEVWLDEAAGWNWRWRAEGISSEKGFWAMGEAIIDAVVTRFPDFFVPLNGEGVNKDSAT